MKLHNIAPGSAQFHYRKCTICKLTVKPGETIVAEGPRFSVHRGCLTKWLDDSYIRQPLDNGARRETRAEREARRAEEARERFNEYRNELLERYGAEEEQDDNESACS